MNYLTSEELQTLADAGGVSTTDFQTNVVNKLDSVGIGILKAIAARIRALGG